MKCTNCYKPLPLCICPTLQILTPRTQVLILQHPQEPRHILSSARMAHLSLPNSTLRTGLSWPNLSTALGKPAQPSQWAVLYLGSGVKKDKDQQKLPALQFVTRQGQPTSRPKDIEGVVVLDGTWSQAKALWWRNAWLLKLNRIILTPTRKSLYGRFRKEPRKECLSTIESIAEVLDALGEDPKMGEGLRTLFSGLLESYQQIPQKR